MAGGDGLYFEGKTKTEKLSSLKTSSSTPAENIDENKYEEYYYYFVIH
jgi:hypothetical protein